MRLIRTIVLASVSFLGLAAAAPLAQAHMVCREVIDAAPPPLPEYDQPPIPGPGYAWTPGYWSNSDDSGYYWVPGTWAQPPRHGLLWTPGYWGWSDGAFAFHPGYWGAVVGFYGGVNYGHGYGGAGYEGGYWRGDRFFYNRAANNFGNVPLPDVYEKPFDIHRGPQVSYHGGPGGIVATPTQQEIAAERAEHAPPTAEQMNHVQMAAKNPALRLTQNNGHPPIAATARPAEFNGAAAPGLPAATAPNAGPAMRPERLPTQGGPLAPMQRAPGQANPLAPTPAHPPAAATAAPHPIAPTPPLPAARTLPSPAEERHPPVAAPHPTPEMRRPIPAMPHPPVAAPHPAPEMRRPVPAMPHPEVGAPHAPPEGGHPGPAGRRPPGEERRP